MTHVFGLTGGVASGKSTVAQRFRHSGVPVIDADQLAHAVVEPGSEALAEIARTFGSDIVDAAGQLRRRELGRRVFADDSLLQQLNAIVHPRVAALFKQRVAALDAQGVKLACYDVPLLFERNLEHGLRPVVVVSAPLDVQLGRLMSRNGLPHAEAQARIDAQMPLAEKVTRADYVIDNSGSIEQTWARADEVLQAIRKTLNIEP
jgi:dephospho-CoA kinase